MPPKMMSYQFSSVRDVICEDDGLNRLGEIVRERFDVSNVMIVTDKGLTSLGFPVRAMASLDSAGFNVAIFDDVIADPPEHIIHKAVDQAKSFDADMVIGFGGGSSIDVAKLVAALTVGDQKLSDIYGLGKVTGSRLPLLQIPTTSGSGSEVTSVAIVTTGESSKMGVGSPKLFADVALLDAKLTLGLPKNITAYTAIDAMVHAIEAYTSKIKKNPTSDMYARQCLRLIGDSIVGVCKNGKNIDGRRNLLMGAMYGGAAFANAPVGAVHALAYPVGAIHHIPHGLSNSLMLSAVLKFNKSSAANLYAELADECGLKGKTNDAKADAFIQWLEEIAEAVGVERRLRDVGIAQDDLQKLAEDSMLQTRLLVNNPREVKLKNALEIYEASW